MIKIADSHYGKMIYATDPAKLLAGFRGEASPENIGKLSRRFGLPVDAVAKGLAQRSPTMRRVDASPSKPSSQAERVEEARRIAQYVRLTNMGFSTATADQVSRDPIPRSWESPFSRC
jgi:hypothetical protein